MFAGRDNSRGAAIQEVTQLWQEGYFGDSPAGPCPVGATRPDSDHLEPATLQRTPMRCQARPLRRRRGSAALLHDAQNYPPRIRAGLWSRGVTPLRSSLFRYLLTVLLAFAATRVVATLGAALAVPPGGSLLQSLAGDIGSTLVSGHSEVRVRRRRRPVRPVAG